MNPKNLAEPPVKQGNLQKTGWLLAGLLVAAAVRGRLRQQMQQLTGHAVLITGGSRGLGLLLAQEFGREGCRIAICARDEQDLQRARQILQASGIEALAIRCDVSKNDEVKALVAQVVEQFGRIDILVNNAGIIQGGPYPTLQLSDFERAHDVMFWGMLYPILAVAPGMMARRQGRIVNITSIGGKVSIPHLLPYSCAKFAAVGLSEGLSAELAQYGIRVTTVAPGLMRTGSHLQAEFKGQPNKEFTTFSLMASLPIISMDARRAARQIVSATKRGATECTLSIPATLLAFFHGLWPGPTVQILGAVNRFLPQPGEVHGRGVLGKTVQEQMPAGQRQVFNLATSLGQQAAQRYQHILQ
jgi:NAD(P)-dependent dehydrogenase (short-subunit alcohol dehydrogenase family)